VAKWKVRDDFEYLDSGACEDGGKMAGRWREEEADKLCDQVITGVLLSIQQKPA
jgi:hypothetical protein